MHDLLKRNYVILPFNISLSTSSQPPGASYHKPFTRALCLEPGTFNREGPPLCLSAPLVNEVGSLSRHMGGDQWVWAPGYQLVLIGTSFLGLMEYRLTCVDRCIIPLLRIFPIDILYVSL